ncbi:MAG: hypothetical protein GC204_19040 [Chloroflexi bacterium]|nr:hypothetical protein [Chloroflexota bacterium]
MHVQANLPNAVPGQDVTFLILGDVDVKNNVTGIVPVEVTVAALSNVNVREAPTLDSFVSGTLSTGQTVTARGRLADNSWLYIDRPDQNGAGWVYGPSMSNAADIEKLSIVNPDTAFYGPMQAFYLQTGEDDNPKCSEAPENGLIIQTSEGVAQVSLWINEVKIRLGSTAFIQAERNKTMTITMLEGTSHVEAKGVEMSASAGSQLSIPLDQNLAAAAPPSAPVPITNRNIQNLPVKSLDRQITVPTLMPSATATFTVTPVPPTNTLTNTPTPTATVPTGDTPTATNTVTNTPPPLVPTATNTVTNTSPPLVPTATNTATNTPVLVPTNTFTATNTPALVPTNTFTATNTPVLAPTNTFTATNTPVLAPTATNTATNTPVLVPTNTFTATNTATNTPVLAPTNTFTSTNVPTATRTSTGSPASTESVGQNPTNTPTNTPVSIAASTSTVVA